MSSYTLTTYWMQGRSVAEIRSIEAEARGRGIEPFDVLIERQSEELSNIGKLLKAEGPQERLDRLIELLGRTLNEPRGRGI